jgi:ATP-dependent Clp protease ATP-binding subunit ClpA
VLRPNDSVLRRYTRDLTADARAGRLDPIRARMAEIARLIDILLRYGKNNAALVGPAGVGKTAIAEGLAQRIAAGDVPMALRNVRLLALDHVSLLGGTMYRGQYEERVTGLVEGATASGDVILFIDELHNLIGQGTAIGVAMDAGNMLKPALVRGDFRVIGATTSLEYQRWICGDPALERRFQKIDVRELSAEETRDILLARVERLERHHNVVIAEDAVEAAIRLTDVHVTDRMRPDRALDALDEACAHAHAVTHYMPVTETLIEQRRAALRGGGAASPRSDSPPIDPIGPGYGVPMDIFERFGAELEAMFLGPSTPPAAPPRAATAPAHAPTRPLVEVEAELRARLMEDGAVVRGVDIARAVAVATGHRVVWPA